MKRRRDKLLLMIAYLIPWNRHYQLLLTGYIFVGETNEFIIHVFPLETFSHNNHFHLRLFTAGVKLIRVSCFSSISEIKQFTIIS